MFAVSFYSFLFFFCMKWKWTLNAKFFFLNAKAFPTTEHEAHSPYHCGWPLQLWWFSGLATEHSHFDLSSAYLSDKVLEYCTAALYRGESAMWAKIREHKEHWDAQKWSSHLFRNLGHSKPMRWIQLSFITSFLSFGNWIRSSPEQPHLSHPVWLLDLHPIGCSNSSLEGMLAADQSFLIYSGSGIQASTEPPGGKNNQNFPTLEEHWQYVREQNKSWIKIQTWEWDTQLNRCINPSRDAWRCGNEARTL